MKKILALLLVVTPILAFAQVGMGTLVVDESAQLEIFSEDQGILLPRLTNADRNALVNPAYGLLIYNSDTNTWEHNRGTAAAPVWNTINTESASTSYVSQSAKFSNTDTSTNVNNATAIDLPVFGTEEWNDNSSLFVVSSNSLQVTEAGRFKININVSLLSNSSSSRKAPEIYITVNDVQVGSYASSSYIRRNSGHEEGSLHLNEVLNLNANDMVKVQIVRAANGNTAVLRSAGSTNLYIEKVN
ncbi:hypothetical protein POV27_15685 [Aureisphaera galaxeae]|uniref:hypothetical protein n=1 Tax=Aureisphaera galaxeae TaxID=1538023 RepID=UPI002350C5DE|nr:hypothetical protein [Aureisphaera galaxeae]MDC8005499.1 hypothetical protein [Aureisphaera galaxeae]